MTAQEIAAALQRVEAVVQRRPDFAMQEEAPATARWEGGTRIVASHANGARIATDMPREFGGAGSDVTPGWLFRAGFAACTATCIAMGAALVEDSYCCSPISSAVRSAVPVDLHIEIGDS